MITTIPGSEWTQRATELLAEGWLLMDLTAVDRLRLDGGGGRFEVVVQLINHATKERQSIHVVADGEPPTVPSVTALWPTANFFEREVFDLFGIAFEGHPNLTRIMMPEAWEGHPLRKDYGVGKVAVEFVPQPMMQVDGPGQRPAGGDAGVQLDRLGQVVVEGDAP